MSKISYEEAFKELNEIIGKIEEGNASISEVGELLERGKELVKVCYGEIDKTKGKLTEIKETLDKLEEE